MLNEQLKRLIAANKISEAISIMTEIINDKDEEMSNDIETLKEKRVEGVKTKLLFVGSLPKDLSVDFQIEKEYLEIRKVFNNARDLFEATEVFNTTSSVKNTSNAPLSMPMLPTQMQSCFTTITTPKMPQNGSVFINW